MSFTEFWIINGAILAYFFPTLVACYYGNSRTQDFLIFNLLIGWTFFGWLWLTTEAFSEG